MTFHNIQPKVLLLSGLMLGIYETLLKYDGIFTLLTRWSIAILTIIYLIKKLKQKRSYGKEESNN